LVGGHDDILEVSLWPQEWRAEWRAETRERLLQSPC
jgi:hypothetical protein